jgi:hypothetical protein
MVRLDFEPKRDLFFCLIESTDCENSQMANHVARSVTTT